jgi:hypothetical protein
MGKIPSGILGRVSGKIADVVGASWKGIPYIRQYVIPGNPNSLAQQAVRERFADLVALAKAALGPVLQPFWDPFIRQNSGWASFIGLNMPLYTTPGDFSSVLMARGNLENTVITGAAYAGTDVTVAWDGTCLGNGQPTDHACILIYDETNKVAFFHSTVARSVEGDIITVGAGRTASELNAWLFFVDDPDDPTVISYSDHYQVTT